MMNLIQLDAIKVALAQGRTPMYADRDVFQVMRQTVTIPYGAVTDISPDIKLVLSNAGHILGSATCMTYQPGQNLQVLVVILQIFVQDVV